MLIQRPVAIVLFAVFSTFACTYSMAQAPQNPPCPYQLLFQNGPLYFYNTVNCTASGEICQQESCCTSTILLYNAQITQLGCKSRPGAEGCKCKNLIPAVGNDITGVGDLEAYPDQSVSYSSGSPITHDSTWIRWARVSTNTNQWDYYKIFKYSFTGNPGTAKLHALRLTWQPSTNHVYHTATRAAGSNDLEVTIVTTSGTITETYKIIQE